MDGSAEDLLVLILYVFVSYSLKLADDNDNGSDKDDEESQHVSSTSYLRAVVYFRQLIYEITGTNNLWQDQHEFL